MASFIGLQDSGIGAYAYIAQFLDRKHSCAWNSKQKYKPYELFKDETLFWKAWVNDFISYPHKFQKLTGKHCCFV